MARSSVAAALLLALVAACTDPEPPGPPAPLPLDGTWALTWSCSGDCWLPEPSLVHSGRLTIAGDQLRWHDPVCSECATAEVGLMSSCAEVPARVTSVEELAYSACLAAENELAVTITARRTGGTGLVSTWRAVGHRD